ncbi:MAG TPA: hypothetical protein VF594_07465 [Rubricoccaceae bacterium]|jgi:cytoskeletal protein CcmA (bactofilin family)
MPVRFSAALAALLFAAPALAQGQFSTVPGAGPRAWTSASTWTLTAGTDADGFPDADDAVTVTAGTMLEISGAPVASASATVEAGATVTGGRFNSASWTVSGVFTNRGTLVNYYLPDLLVGGGLVNGGTWDVPTTLTGAAPTLALEGNAVFSAPITVASPTAVVTALTDLVVGGPAGSGAGLALGNARLAMGPHRLTLDTRSITGTVGGTARIDLAGDSLVLRRAAPSTFTALTLRDVAIDGPVLAEASCRNMASTNRTAWCDLAGVSAASLTAVGDVGLSGTLSVGALDIGPSGGVRGTDSNLGNLLTVSGRARNRGALEGVRLRAGGDLDNGGEWRPRETRLLAGPHSLSGSGVFAGTFTVDAGASLAAASDVTFTVALPLNGATFDLGPHTLRLVLQGAYSEVTGPGTLRFTGGGIYGDGPLDAVSYQSFLRALRIEGDVTFSGKVRVDTGLVVVGDLTIAPNSLMQTNRYDVQMRVEGDVVNRGRIDGNNYSLYLDVTGDVLNAGVWQARTTRFVGTGTQTVRTEPGGIFGGYEGLYAPNAGTTVVFGSDVAMEFGDLFLDAGTWDLGPHTLTLGANVSGGISDISGEGTLRSSGGTIRGLEPLTSTTGNPLNGIRIEGDVTFAGFLALHDRITTPGGVRTHHETTVTGNATVAEGATLRPAYYDTSGLRVGGDLTVVGTIEHPNGYTFNLTATGALRTRPRTDGSRPLFKNLRTITVGGLDVDGATFFDTFVRSTGGVLTQFQNAAFTNAGSPYGLHTSETQLIIDHAPLPGDAPFVVRNVSFLPLYDREGGEGSHDSGRYLYALGVRVDMVESAFGAGNYEWRDGSGESQTQGWFVGGNVSWATVEQALLAADVFRVQEINNGRDPSHPAFAGFNARASEAGTVTATYRNGPINSSIAYIDAFGQTVRAGVWQTSTTLVVDPVITVEAAPVFSASAVAAAPTGTEAHIGILNSDGTLAVAPVVAAGGANAVAAGGANAITAGSANVVANASAPVVASGGANVVASGGGNVVAVGGMNSPRGLARGDAGAAPPPGTSVEVFLVYLPVVRVAPRVLLDGALDAAPAEGGPPMRAGLRAADLVPLVQPYGAEVFDETPANFPLHTFLPPSFVAARPDIVDWVMVELRPSAADTAAAVRRPALLLRDGRVVDWDGTDGPVAFPGIAPGAYHVVVRHRNHVPVMSAAPLALTSTATVYDFTTAIGQAYSAGSAPMRGTGANGTAPFALFAADGDHDGRVLASDIQAVWRSASGAEGYLQADFDLDGRVLASDVQERWRAGVGVAESPIPESGGAQRPAPVEAPAALQTSTRQAD